MSLSYQSSGKWSPPRMVLHLSSKGAFSFLSSYHILYLYMTIGKLRRFKPYFSHVEISIVLISISKVFCKYKISPWGLTYYILNIKNISCYFLFLFLLISLFLCYISELKSWTDHIIWRLMTVSAARVIFCLPLQSVVDAFLAIA